MDGDWKKQEGSTQTLKLRGELLDCGIWAQILSDLGIRMVREITNSLEKDMTFNRYGIDLVDRVRI